MELHRRALMDETYPPLPYRPPRSRSLSPVWAFSKGDGRRLNLLLVEHDPAYAATLKGIVEKCKNPGLKIEWTEWLDAATHRVREGGVDAVLLDISLPDVSGIEIFRAIHHAAPEVPVLILADLDDETVACRVIHEGAQDYLPKHAVNPQHLHRSIRFAVERSRAKKGSTRKRGRLVEGPPSAWGTLPALRTSLDESSRSLTGFPEPVERAEQPEGSATLGDRSEIPVPSQGHATKILVVEPSDKDYRKLRVCLKGHPEIRTFRAKTMASALALMARHPFDLVCLDYFLPDGTGHDFLTRLNQSGLDLPVVIITGHSDPMAAAQIIQAGASDFLPKQKLGQSPLLRVIVNALEKARFQKEIKEAQRKIIEMSILDDLTGLCNRRHFMDLLEKESARALRYGTPLVLCMMDVDEFKRVNDVYGHQAGDMVLHELGGLLRKSVRMSDTVCRYGGEEFALLLPNTDLAEATIQGERLRRLFETHRFEWKGTPFRVTLSFGLARLHCGANPPPAALVEEADNALYKAKRDGKNRVAAHEGDQPL